MFFSLFIYLFFDDLWWAFWLAYLSFQRPKQQEVKFGVSWLWRLEMVVWTLHPTRASLSVSKRMDVILWHLGLIWKGLRRSPKQNSHTAQPLYGHEQFLGTILDSFFYDSVLVLGCYRFLSPLDLLLVQWRSCDMFKNLPRPCDLVM